MFEIIKFRHQKYQRVQTNTEVKLFDKNEDTSMIRFSHTEQTLIYHAFTEVVCIDSAHHTNKVG